MCVAPYFNAVTEVLDKEMNNTDFSMIFLFRNLLILVSIPMDLEILFFMYVIWSDKFNLLSIITPKNLILLTFTKLLPLICTLIFMNFVFNSGTMEQHILSFLNIDSQFVGFKPLIYLF